MNVRLHAVLVLLALAAGTLAAIAGGIDPPLAADEVSAVELAQWIRDQKPGLLVIDARTAEAFDQDHLPGAKLLADIDADAIDAAQTVVVYADVRADAGGLAHLDALRVLRLHGGMAAWNDDVLFPVLHADASERTQRDFIARAVLSRYFGGSPRLLDPGAMPVRGRSRRGC
jgi:rhodanese-related sulfurtransferase